MTHMTHMTHFPYIIPLRVCTRAHTWKRLLWKVRHGATCASCASCQPTNLAGSMGLSEAAAAGRRLASLMPGKPPCASLAGTASYRLDPCRIALSASGIRAATPTSGVSPSRPLYGGGASSPGVTLPKLSAPYPHSSRTRGRGPRSLPWGIIHRTLGRTERIFPLRLILEISK